MVFDSRHLLSHEVSRQLLGRPKRTNTHSTNDIRQVIDSKRWTSLWWGLGSGIHGP